MVKQSVEEYNGTITVESVEGDGTTFTVAFPVHEDYLPLSQTV
jgi:signal transduction histidine kinase